MRGGRGGEAKEAAMQMDISTIVFALVAVFVAWKLRSVLGPAARRNRRSSAARPAP